MTGTSSSTARRSGSTAYAVDRRIAGEDGIPGVFPVREYASDHNADETGGRSYQRYSLRRYARKKAQQVLKARRRTTLEPMNAYERHVIHAALQDMENITTHSTGVEPNRCVVIEYVR